MYIVSSSQNRPTSCMPIGRRKSSGPSGGESIPHGIDRAGWPVLLNGSVFQVYLHGLNFQKDKSVDCKTDQPVVVLVMVKERCIPWLRKEFSKDLVAVWWISRTCMTLGTHGVVGITMMSTSSRTPSYSVRSLRNKLCVFPWI